MIIQTQKPIRQHLALAGRMSVSESIAKVLAGRMSESIAKVLAGSMNQSIIKALAGRMNQSIIKALNGWTSLIIGKALAGTQEDGMKAGFLTIVRFKNLALSVRGECLETLIM